MATVVEKSKNTPVDKKLAEPNRTNAGTPIGALTPLYKGEMVLDTTSGTIYYALGLTNTSWALASISG